MATCDPWEAWSSENGGHRREVRAGSRPVQGRGNTPKLDALEPCPVDPLAMPNIAGEMETPDASCRIGFFDAG